MIVTAIELSDFDVDEERGFLPALDPLTALPGPYAVWDEIAAGLPKSLRMGRGRRHVKDIPPLDPADLRDGPELERAMLLLSYLAHGYLNDSDPPTQVLPANIAVPWYAVATRLGRPPILSYASHQLHNWGRYDAQGSLELENLVRLQDFYGGMDDDWFVMVHVAIEAAAGPGLRAMVEAQDAVELADNDRLAAALSEVAASLTAMHSVLSRMPERCEPFIYYHRVRQFLFGWANNPAYPNGLVYEGVVEYNGVPQLFSGETGAQSAIIPFLDAALGISDQDDPLRDFMLSLRAYIPPRHRAFINEIGPRVDLRKFVLTKRYAPVLSTYNACIAAMHEFRELHLRYAASYVHRQGQLSDANSTETGTGGTPFMRYLKRHLDNVAEHAIA